MVVGAYALELRATVPLDANDRKPEGQTGRLHGENHQHTLWRAGNLLHEVERALRAVEGDCGNLHSKNE